MLRPRNPPNRSTQIPQYRFNRVQNLNLNLYHQIPRNRSSSVWWISGMQHFWWKLPHLIYMCILICIIACNTKSRNSDSSGQIQISPKSQFEFVPPDTEESELLDLVDLGGVAFSVETVIQEIHVYPDMHHRAYKYTYISKYIYNHICILSRAR